MRVETIEVGGDEAIARVAAVLAACPAGTEVALALPAVAWCPAVATPLVALADHYRRRGVRVTFDLPDGGVGASAVAGFLRERLSPPEEGFSFSPFDRVWRFSTYDELNVLVNALVLQTGKSARLGKGVKEALFWCFNEVMDNVLTHAAPDGRAQGYVMTGFLARERRLKVCVFDLGIGLKASFAGSRYRPVDDYEAIVTALKANVTSGIGQGNGLWGLHELIRRAEGGSLSLASGGAEYLFSPKDGVDGPVAYAALPGFAGTTRVDFRLALGGEISFASVFPGADAPVDLWQEAHETDEHTVRFNVVEVAGGSGTRPSAAALRYLVENAIANDGKSVTLDFAGAAFCSSAFVDELVGKLLLAYGFVGFTQRVRLVNVQGLAAQLINHSIAQRMADLSREGA